MTTLLDSQLYALPELAKLFQQRWLQTAQGGNVLAKLVVNSHRPNRLEPRVRKRRPKQYPLMKQPRCQLKKELESK